MTRRLQPVIAALMAACLLLPAGAQQRSSQPLFTMKVQSDLVLVNVVVRDRRGNLLRDLKASAFTVLEDGKPQHIQSFDIENVEAIVAGGPSQETVSGPVTANVLTSNAANNDIVRDRRLVVLFFDFGSMQPDDAQRAIDSAQNYVDRQMTPADMVAVVSYASTLQVPQDFTTDRAALTRTLKALSNAEGEGLAQGATADDDQGDTGAEYTPDDTEYNLFNTDMKLQAIASLAGALGKLEQKKSVLYFSGGMSKTGVDNQAQLRVAINTAVRANVSLYPVDIRGLEALPPGGNATQASLRGTSAYSGAAVRNALDKNFSSQETLVTLASDTGGKAFLDSNDFGKAFTKIQQDTESYYLIGYRSTNRTLDGRYRRITVKVNRPDVKLEYRAGYYGPRDFQHFTREDREQQLQDEMATDLPNTDLPLYLGTGYFRMEQDRYFVPVSLVVPGSAIPFVANAEKDKATLDIMGLVREAQSKMPVGNVRETVKLSVPAGPAVTPAGPVEPGATQPRPDAGKRAAQKNIQYETGFLLSPGNFHLKFVVRENQTGKLGSFETDFTVPDIKKAPLKMSSVVLASQRTATGKKSQSPLVRGGSELLPNIAHVFTTDQQLYLYYEVYEPAKKPNVRLLTSIQFFSGKVKAYETPLVEAKQLNTPQRKAAAFQIELPLAQLRPGWYTCQVNVIDDAGGTFAFPRIPMFVRAGTQTSTPAK